MYALRIAPPFWFQSTLPTWGATVDTMETEITTKFQSTLPTWGATPPLVAVCDEDDVSIHAPHVGSDLPSMPTTILLQSFNPRSPRGERPTKVELISLRSGFNPRSPRGERHEVSFPFSTKDCFNPRSPRGERRLVHRAIREIKEFQSTLPTWGATFKV